MPDTRMSARGQSAMGIALRGHATFRFVALALGFAFQIMVVKVLSPANYASYAVLVAVLLVGERLLSFGTDRTFLRMIPALMSNRDRAGIRSLAIRLGSVRAIAIVVFLLALSASRLADMRITPEALTLLTTMAFGVWFIAYSLLKEGDAIAQSLIMHRSAALVAACEVCLRSVALWMIYFYSRSVTVETVIVLQAASATAAAAGLWSVLAISRYRSSFWIAPQTEVELDQTLQRKVPMFAMSAYASTLSFLISSAGVIRLVARTGLSIHALAAFSFVQGLATSLSSGLPGQLILPSLESVAATMAGRDSKDRIIPVLSLLFKVELACVLSVIIATTIAGPRLVEALSRPEYAPYYRILPALMIVLLFQTIYRLMEILGSANLEYRIFLALWPLSVASVVTLYFTVSRWGLISVVVVPMVEIMMRVGIVTFALRHHGVSRALDYSRSLKVVMSAMLVLAVSLSFLAYWGAYFDESRSLIATGGIVVFLSTFLILRPLRIAECEALSGFLPASWTLPLSVARRLARE